MIHFSRGDGVRDFVVALSQVAQLNTQVVESEAELRQVQQELETHKVHSIINHCNIGVHKVFGQHIGFLLLFSRADTAYGYEYRHKSYVL